MTRCQECGYNWDSRPEDAAAVIRNLPAELSQLLGTLGISDPDTRLRNRPTPDVWSPLEYLAHTADAIAWYADRVHRVLTEHHPALDPFDWDAHTAGQRYHDRHLDDVLDDVSRSCARFTADVDWQREGVGSDGRPRTVAQLTHRAAHEARHHLLDVRRHAGDDT